MLDEENRDWTWKDMVVDMIWNVLAISSRVLALALFAGYQLYCWLGLVSGQFVILAIVKYVLPSKFKTENVGKCTWVFVSLFVSSLMIYNLFYAFPPVPCLLYFVYSSLIFVENVVFVSLWFYWSSGLGLWYHEAAIAYVICAYALSFVVHFVHMYRSGELEKHSSKVVPEQQRQEYIQQAPACSVPPPSHDVG